MTFHVGQQVVCIRDFTPLESGEIVPEKSEVYTVRAITYGGNGLLLAEIVNAPRAYDDHFGECSFWAWAFRPLVKTDISIFTAMLNPIPHKENIDACA